MLILQSENIKHSHINLTSLGYPIDSVCVCVCVPAHAQKLIVLIVLHERVHHYYITEWFTKKTSEPPTFAATKKNFFKCKSKGGKVSTQKNARTLTCTQHTCFLTK